MPLLLPPECPPECIELIRAETQNFTRLFSEEAATSLPPEAQVAVKQFIQHVEDRIAVFCNIYSPEDETQTTEVVLHFPSFFITLEENIFNSETYPLWQNYIVSLLLQLQPYIADQESLEELLNCISGQYARMCWLDLCVIQMHRVYPDLSQHVNVPTHKKLVLQYFNSSYYKDWIKENVNVATNFCLYYFNLVLQAARNEAKREDRYSLYLSNTPYVTTLRQAANSILVCSEDPLHDARLAQALMHLSYCSSHPRAIQMFLGSRSIFLFSPRFFLNLLTVDANSAVTLVDIALRTENVDTLELSLDLLSDWLERLATPETQNILISSLRELSKHEKLHFANLSCEASNNLFAFASLGADPVSDLVTFLSIASQQPNFLALFKDFSNPAKDGSLTVFYDALFELMTALRKQRYLRPEHLMDIQQLVCTVKPPVSDALVLYLTALSKAQYQSQESINFFLSLARNASSPNDFETLQRLHAIFTSWASLNLDEVIQIINDGKIQNFQEKFKENRNLDMLCKLIKILKIKIDVSAESIKKIIENPKKMQHITLELTKLEAPFMWPAKLSMLQDGLLHLHEIGISFKKKLALLANLNCTTPWVSLLNSQNKTEQYDEEVARSILFHNYFVLSKKGLETDMGLTALLLNFAVGAKLKEAFKSRSDTNPVSPPEYTDFVINTIRNYFTKLQDELNRMTDISDEHRQLAKSRVNTVFARVIQQEANHPDFLMQEANRVAETIDMLQEANPESSDDKAKPLPLLLLRAVVYEHSLLLFRKKTQRLQSTPASLAATQAEPEQEATPEMHAQFVHSFLMS